MPSLPPNLRRVVYVSRLERAAPGQADEEIVAAILATSRRNNPPRGLTGALLHGAGGFVQVLEGPPDNVAERLDVIGRDPRHSGMRIIESADASERVFANWSMAYLQDLDFIPPELAERNASMMLLMRLRAMLQDGRLDGAA
ncbi:BLUF domain-containing protein [Falsiroseomonas sp. CW058]|uniref:BLUF domain-containing protein n=1 Tax=Falsiroseomonas sp. CW058 TaxID=3388664 RepID=UPI003D321B40